MSISYSSIVGFGSGKATLPSVETWGANMNILRDPPKALFTRKIDKVGQTSEITQMIQDSGDRANEAILVYPRGVNPMVAVSYDNYGNNGGQKSGSLAMAGFNVTGGSGKQAYLPYRILDKGAFRPPVMDQRELLPLSRLPRIWTSSFTQPGFADFSKKAVCPVDIGEDYYKGVKKADQMLKACIRPTATYQLETPIVENFEVKYVIKNPIKAPMFSGIQPNAKFNGELGKPVKEIVNNPLRTDINLNQKGEHVQDIDIRNFDTEKYTHDTLKGSFNSNASRNIEVTPISELYNINTDSNIKEHFNLDYTAPLSSYDRYEDEHSVAELDRNLPYYESRTNIGRSIHKRLDDQKIARIYDQNRPTPEVYTNVGGGYTQSIDNISSRQFNLRPTINPGGMESLPTVPIFDRENQIQEVDHQKANLRKSVYEMQQDRNSSLADYPYPIRE